MPIICPTFLAASVDDYKKQIEKIVPFGKRVQIDLTDGQFALSQTINRAKYGGPPALRPTST